MPDENKQRLSELFQAMQKAEPETNYYTLTLTANENGQLLWQTQTGFAGYTEDPKQPPREIRKACQVKGQVMLDLWKDVGCPGLAVNNTTQLAIYLHLGGNAIVEDKLSKGYFPHIHEEQIFAPTGAIGARPISEAPPTALKRVPTPKLRMKILKRDGYKCRVCGRSPDRNIDIELHVHHYRPWAQGGLTEDANLITLCHTCHKGLDPHYELSLANIFQEAYEPVNKIISNSGHMDREYHLGVQRYREHVRKLNEKRNK